MSSNAGSIPGMLIHHVLQRLTFAESFQIFQEAIDGGFEKALHTIGGVRRQKHVGHAPERMIGRKRLLVEYVQCSAANLAGFEGANERGLIDHWSSTDVQNHRGWLHR